MDSLRFARPVRITRHARARMAEREIPEPLLLDLIETGDTRYKDATRLWLFKHYPDRMDNLLCAAAVIEDELIIKTVMHHFALEESAL